MAPQIIRDAMVVTMDDASTVLERGEVLIRDGRIEACGKHVEAGEDARITEAPGAWLLPGFIQPHVHLCQTLLRGHAEDMTLLEWLRERVWPMEAAHDAGSMAASVKLGIHELLSSGTTCILDMGTVQHTEIVFEQAAALGIRALAGKAMMQIGEGLPPALREDGAASLAASIDLASRYHGSSGGRIGYVFCPRFLAGVSEDLLGDVVTEARRLGCRMQTHTSENPDENRIVEDRVGVTSLELLERTGFLGDDVTLVHVIHISDRELDILSGSGTHVVHCPGSNAKLGSGTARVPEMLEAGVNVALAADGAPCNNNLSVFKEMRLAAQMQSLRLGPGSLPAERIVRMATRGGARAMGMDKEIGSIEKGKRADLVLLDPGRAHSAAPLADPYSRIVWSMDERNVRSVWVDGERLVHEGQVGRLDETTLVSEAGKELARLLEKT